MPYNMAMLLGKRLLAVCIVCREELKQNLEKFLSKVTGNKESIGK